MRTGRVLLSLGFAAAIAGSEAAAQAQAPGPMVPRSLLRGLVVNDNDDTPIAGATVQIEALKFSFVTDSTGAYRLPAIPPGRFVVTVKRLGYAPVTSVVTFNGRDTLEYDFGLIKQATILPEVDVTTAKPIPPKLVEFEQRRASGFGRFITAEELEKNVNRRPSELVAKIPGPRIMRGWGNYGWIASSVGSGAIERGRSFQLSPMDKARGADPNQCYAAVMLDGNHVFSGRPGEQLFDINLIPTNTIAGIEYYRDAATVPAKFGGTRGETCGLIAIWTK